ncbi:MAG: FitA-like ribbon-helix-helix domain-containing protein [Sporichthyaceae bacterium]
MASVTVRDLPDEARDELAARAARSGRSLQAYLRMELIALTQRPDAEAFAASVRERKRRTGSTFPAEAILAALDEGRRER